MFILTSDMEGNETLEARQTSLIRACESEDASALAALIASSVVDKPSLRVKDILVSNLQLHALSYSTFLLVER